MLVHTSIQGADDETDYVYGVRIPEALTPNASKPPGVPTQSTAMYHFYGFSQSEFAGRDNSDVLVIYI